MPQNTEQMEIWLENVNQIVAALEVFDTDAAMTWAQYMRADLTSHIAAAKETA